MNLQHDLRLAIHRHLYELDFSRHDALSVGDIMSRSTADLTLIQQFFFSVPMLVANMTLLVVAIVVMFFLSPLLSLVVVVFVPLFAFVGVRFRDRVFPASWNDQRLSGSVAGVVDEAVTGVRVVKAFAQEQREFDRLTDRAHELFQSRLRTARFNARYSSTLQALPMLAQVAVLGLGGWLALEGHITLGVFLAFASYLVQIVTPIRLVSSMLATTQQARAGAERVFELLDLQPGVRDEPDARPLVDARGGIELRPRHASATATGPSTLHDISLTIRPGERIGIVGASGSGKTTLAFLIARFYDPTQRHRAHRRRRRPRLHAGVAALGGQRRVRGELPVLDHDPRQHRLRPARAPATPRSRPRRASPRPTTSSSSCPTATTPSSASGASRCRAASANASPSPAPRWPTPRCSCSTTPRRPSTPAPRRRSTPRCPTSWAPARPSSSPTGPRRCGWPTACSSSTAGGSSPRAPTPSCGTPRRCTASCSPGPTSSPSTSTLAGVTTIDPAAWPRTGDRTTTTRGRASSWPRCSPA